MSVNPVNAKASHTLVSGQPDTQPLQGPFYTSTQVSKLFTDERKDVFELSSARQTALSQNLRLAREAFDYVKGLKLQSNTRIELDIQKARNRLQGLTPSQGLIKEADEDSVSKMGALFRHIMQMSHHLKALGWKGVGYRCGFSTGHRTLDSFVEQIRTRSIKHNFGNCAEQAIHAAHYLANTKKYTNFALVNLAIVHKSQVNQFIENRNAGEVDLETPGHTFLVIGLDEKADLCAPETWGPNAVILDPWGDIVAPVHQPDNPKQDGITRLHQLFDVTPDQTLVFCHWLEELNFQGVQNPSVYNWKNATDNTTPKLYGS